MSSGNPNKLIRLRRPISDRRDIRTALKARYFLFLFCFVTFSHSHPHEEPLTPSSVLRHPGGCVVDVSLNSICIYQPASGYNLRPAPLFLLLGWSFSNSVFFSFPSILRFFGVETNSLFEPVKSNSMSGPSSPKESAKR